MTDLGKKKEGAGTAGQERERAEPGFTRQQLLESARYRARRDLVSVLLEDGRMYTVAEADQMVGRFMKGKVR